MNSKPDHSKRSTSAARPGAQKPLKSDQAVIILGDQLALDHPALVNIEPGEVPIIFVESAAEGRVVWSHKARIAVFLSAMRHFADTLRANNHWVVYSDLSATGEKTLVDRIFELLRHLGCSHATMMEPGEWRLEQDLLQSARATGVSLHLLDDPHFLCSRSEFTRWASGYKQLRMEYFYREMRKRHDVLMEDGQPVSGQWNFDSDNRSPFPKSGPGAVMPAAWFEPDSLTRDVLQEIEMRFPSHPGKLEAFAWPVTREQALYALDVFVNQRLSNFGQFQDAMWTDLPFGWHSLVASAINLHLISPREAIDAAVGAWQAGKAELAATEGFVRQILGWREFIRGVYWLDMPAMREANFLKAENPLPSWFWTADTHMNCMKQSIGQTLDYGYAHHIQRLMVIGNFALLAGIEPRQVEEWFLAVYVDAVEWVELPNVAGMALFANGGRFTSKPYAASGAYIKKMSNYCQGCRYDPAQKTGAQACPMTSLYWGFLDRHEAMLAANPRTSLMVKHLSKLDAQGRQAIRQQAESTLSRLNEV